MNAPNQLSFLPDDYLERKARRRANILCGALSVIVLAGIGGAFSVTERSMHEVELRHDAIVRNSTEAAKRIEQVKQMHDQQRRIVQHAQLAASLVEKIPRSNLLAALTNDLPSGVSLLDFSLESHQRVSAPQTGTAFDQRKAALDAQRSADAGGMADVPKEDVPLKLTGVAETDVQVAQYMSKLNACPLLKDVNLVISESVKQNKETMRRFQIEMMINPNAEVLDADKANKTAALELKN
jgi:Tfp pilus assembly protein PilN